MKKMTLTAIIALGVFGFSGLALAEKSAANNAHHQVQYQKDLKLTQDQATTIVEAALIRHGQANAKIQKVETLSLAGDKHYYLVYANLQNSNQTNAFFLVSAQTGRVIPSMALDHNMYGKHFMFVGGLRPDMAPPMPH